MSKLTLRLSLLALATLPYALGCSGGNCVPIPDGVYTAVDPDGGPLFTPAFVAPALSDLTDGSLVDAAVSLDAADRDAAARDAAPRDAAVRDAPRDANPADAAHRDAAAHDADPVHDAGRDAAAHDADTAHDAATAHDADTVHDAETMHDAASTVDAGTPTDAGGTVPVTYTFRGGIPAPYDTWDCTKPTLTCEMTYICSKPGEQTVSIVTTYVTGTHAAFAFSITPPGTVVHLQPPR